MSKLNDVICLDISDDDEPPAKRPARSPVTFYDNNSACSGNSLALVNPKIPIALPWQASADCHSDSVKEPLPAPCLEVSLEDGDCQYMVSFATDDDDDEEDEDQEGEDSGGSSRIGTSVPSENGQHVKDVVEYVVDLVATVHPGPKNIQDVQLLNVKEKEKAADGGVEKLVCELNLSPTKVSNAMKKCSMCSKSSIKYDLIRNGRLEFLCSDACLHLIKNSRRYKCVSCKKSMEADTFSYWPRFGYTNAALCSDFCLIRYESETVPIRNCVPCKKPMSRTAKKTYSWQTRDYCSAVCLTRTMKEYVSCSYCKSIVGVGQRGKYGVRFGNTVRQFCNGLCLDKYKKRQKTCTFCQNEIVDTRKVISSFGEGERKTMKDFCNSDCLINFKEIYYSKLETKNDATTTTTALPNLADSLQMMDGDLDFCDTCQVLIRNAAKNAIKIRLKEQNYTVCSLACQAAFRKKHNCNLLFCDNCHLATVYPQKVNLLTVSGQIKVFCTSRCVILFVLKTRAILACFKCKVKKYTFDLAEEFDKDTEQTRLYCSVQCLTEPVTLELEEERRINGVESIVPAPVAIKQFQNVPPQNIPVRCATCKKFALAKFHLKANNMNLNSFCSLQCVNSYQVMLKSAAITIPSSPNQKVNTTSNGANSRYITLSSLGNFGQLPGTSFTPQNQTTWTPNLTSTPTSTTVNIQPRSAIIQPTRPVNAATTYIDVNRTGVGLSAAKEVSRVQTGHIPRIEIGGGEQVANDKVLVGCNSNGQPHQTIQQVVLQAGKALAAQAAQATAKGSGPGAPLTFYINSSGAMYQLQTDSSTGGVTLPTQQATVSSCLTNLTGQQARSALPPISISALLQNMNQIPKSATGLQAQHPTATTVTRALSLTTSANLHGKSPMLTTMLNSVQRVQSIPSPSPSPLVGNPIQFQTAAPNKLILIKKLRPNDVATVGVQHSLTMMSRGLQCRPTMREMSCQTDISGPVRPE